MGKKVPIPKVIEDHDLIGILPMICQRSNQAASSRAPVPRWNGVYAPYHFAGKPTLHSFRIIGCHGKIISTVILQTRHNMRRFIPDIDDRGIVVTRKPVIDLIAGNLRVPVPVPCEGHIRRVKARDTEREQEA